MVSPEHGVLNAHKLEESVINMGNGKRHTGEQEGRCEGHSVQQIKSASALTQWKPEVRSGVNDMTYAGLLLTSPRC